MVKRHLIQSSVLVAGILSASLGLAEPPALKTVWLRFEDKEAGKQVILAENSSSSAEAQAEGVNIDPAKPAPVYVDFKPPQGRFKIIDGETGQEYDNDRACKVEQAGTCGAGYIEIRNVVFASYLSATIELFYQTPEDIGPLKENVARLLVCATPSGKNPSLGIYVGTSGQLVCWVNGKQFGTEPFLEPSTLYHIALVIAGTDNAGGPVDERYTEGHAYLFVNGQPVGPAEGVDFSNADGGFEGVTTAWLGTGPGNEKTCTAAGLFDEFRITYNAGSHNGAAALKPEQFLRMDIKK